MQKKIFVVLLVVLFAGCGLRSDDQNAATGGKKNIPQEDYTTKAVALLKENKIPEAIQNFHKAIAQEPDNIANYLVLSQVYARLGNPEGAVNILTKALQIAPEDGEIYFLLSQTFYSSQEIDAALLAAQKSVESFIKAKDEIGLRKSVTYMRQLLEERNSATAN